MQLNEFFLAELVREASRTRNVLLQVPADHGEWKPHDKSMKFGYLADMLSIMPTWIAAQVTKDELDIAPPDGPQVRGEPNTTSASLISALDTSLMAARTALSETTHDHLQTVWRLKAGGEVVQENPRYLMIQDTFNHWAHHRGQMTVYLRLLGAKVPAVYGPSADERAFP